MVWASTTVAFTKTRENIIKPLQWSTVSSELYASVNCRIVSDEALFLLAETEMIKDRMGLGVLHGASLSSRDGDYGHSFRIRTNATSKAVDTSWLENRCKNKKSRIAE
ncbi:hypothetical protein QTP88_004806 [Uroleucon formosanum]